MLCCPCKNKVYLDFLLIHPEHVYCKSLLIIVFVCSVLTYHIALFLIVFNSVLHCLFQWLYCAGICHHDLPFCFHFLECLYLCSWAKQSISEKPLSVFVSLFFDISFLRKSSADMGVTFIYCLVLVIVCSVFVTYLEASSIVVFRLFPSMVFITPMVCCLPS